MRLDRRHPPPLTDCCKKVRISGNFWPRVAGLQSLERPPHSDPMIFGRMIRGATPTGRSSTKFRQRMNEADNRRL